MRTIESRRFVSGTAGARLSLVEEGGPLPFRIRLRLDGRRGESGVMAGYATEDEAAAALEAQAQKAVAAGWVQVPAQVRLVLEIPAPPSAKMAVPAAPCAHPAIRAWRPELGPARLVVCPDCEGEVAT